MKSAHLLLSVLAAVAVNGQWWRTAPPPGARVEVEFEYVEPPSAGATAGASGTGTSGGSNPPPGGTTAPAPTPRGSQYTQAFLTNLLNMALNMRTMSRNNAPLPIMDEPCPCEVECCMMPTEARRVIAVMRIPNTIHAGCCGCIECPLSLSPMVTNSLRYAQMLDTRFGTPAPAR